jgi:hypothetical protein
MQIDGPLVPLHHIIAAGVSLSVSLTNSAYGASGTGAEDD